MSQKYQLAPEIFVCPVGNSVVYMNALKGHYHRLSFAECQAVSEFVPGWPVMTPLGESNTTADASFDHDIVKSLLTAGVLVQGVAAGKNATPVAVLPPRSTALDEYEQLDVRVDGRIIAQFFLAALNAAVLSRRSTLVDLTRHLRRRRMKTSRIESGQGKTDEIRRALAEFWILRPLLWTPRTPLLLDRLTLLKFLEYRGINCQWIFGVSLDPFRRFSWLQIGDVVVDADYNVAASYVPIMVI